MANRRSQQGQLLAAVIGTVLGVVVGYAAVMLMS